MSIVLVCLPNAPKVTEEAVKKEAELNRYLETQVEGEIECVRKKKHLLFVKT